MKLPLLAFIVLCVAGCATQIAPMSERREAPPGQVFRVATAHPNPATVQVVRDEGMYGAAVYFHVSLDGKKIASLMPGEFVTFKADPGDHVLSAIPTDPMRQHHPAALETIWREGAAYTYRIGLDSNGGVKMSRLLASDVPLTAPPPRNASSNSCAYGAGPCR